MESNTGLCLSLLLLTCVVCSLGFSGDDKFIKKYAMMKVYESCFGPEVVKEVRKEMKMATAKCSGLMPSSFPIMSNKIHHQAPSAGQLSPTKQQLIALHQLAHQQSESLHHLANQQSQSDSAGSQHAAGATPIHMPHKTSPLQIASDASNKNTSPSFDLQKLQQAILDGYNKHVAQSSATAQQTPALQPSTGNLVPIQYPQQPSQQFRPYQAAQPPVTYNSLPAQAPFPPQYAQPAPAPTYPMFYPSNGAQNGPQMYTNGAQPVQNGAQLYTNGAQTFPNGAQQFQNGAQQFQNGGAQLYQPQQTGYFAAQPSGNFYQAQPAYYQQPYFGNQRASRDLDIRGQLETLTTKMETRVRNVTCVMQELGYLDDKLEPAYEKMVERINRLPVADDLKRDMTDGVEFCKQFSQCVPDERKDKLAREMVRPMFFFRCYKHKKLEACIMKDVRDRYTATEEMSEDTLPSGVGAEMRSMRNQKDKSHQLDENSMEAAIYEFLYGGGESILDVDMPL
ncbi:uncharacterized protein LOC111050194 isoform X2 [Nilaparvata lugens]|uniref:uncharacterized protein LOC111050194 isoform X2 n=1 Tax=Nilaparvata lugens TaxID=108931 RepID=UPI00193CB552|nr:uncharacterized protein LOC111050194 isoform X2 [Nilaparvata lugens]